MDDRGWDDDGLGSGEYDWVNTVNAYFTGSRAWMDHNSENESRLVEELRRACADGARPSDLLRNPGANGVVGGWTLDMMQRALLLELSKKHASLAWWSHGGHDCLDRFLTPFMPVRD